MAIVDGKVIDSFEGMPKREQLQQFFQVLMDEANRLVGPVGVAAKHYEEMLIVRPDVPALPCVNTGCGKAETSI